MPQVTTPSVGPDDLVVEPDSPKDRPPIFAFSSDLTSKTTNSRSEPLDFRARCTIHTVRSGALVLDGVQENMRLGKAGAFHPFPIRAPMDELVPSVFADGSGCVFGKNYRWVGRWVNTDTGEVSGVSPLPRTGWDLGSSGDTSTFVGAKALLPVPTAPSNSGADEYQLFRNTSSQLGIFFLVKQVATSVSFIEDNIPDTELATKLAVTFDFPVTNAMGGRPWPCAKAFQHPGNGRTLLYGTKHMDSFVPNLTTAVGEKPDLSPEQWKITTTTSNHSHGLRSSREGQTLELIDSDSGAGVFRNALFEIVQIPSDTVFYISPPIPDDLDDLGSGFGANNVVDNTVMVVHDNRDRRTVFQSQPNQPYSYDMLEAFFIGFDSDEAINHIWQMGGITHAITNQRIYQILNDATVLPHQSMRINVGFEEGQIGLWAGTYAPFGYVFINDQGCRIFNGQIVQALGSQSVFSDYLAQQQLGTFEPSLIDNTFVFYDTEEHLLHVSYVPRGCATPERELVFDPESGVWRGLWRRRIFTAGSLLADTGDPQIVYGDEHGNLYYDQAQTMDCVNWEGAADPPLVGTILTVASFMVLTTQTTFTAALANKLRGMPILVEKADGSYTLNWIADVPANGKLVLQMIPDDALVAGRGFLVGWIDWQATTAFIDSGEPTHPERFQRLRLRFKKPTAAGTQTIDTDTFKVEVAQYGQDEDAEIATFREVVTTEEDEAIPGTIYLDVEMEVMDGEQVRGRAFQLRLSGQSKQGEPEITQAIADFVVGSGRTPD